MTNNVVDNWQVDINEVTPTVHTRSINWLSESSEHTCFFCNLFLLPAGSVSLHNASTYHVDTNVRRAALDAGGTAVLTKLEAGDMIAIETKLPSKLSRFTVQKNQAGGTQGQ